MEGGKREGGMGGLAIQDGQIKVAKLKCCRMFPFIGYQTLVYILDFRYVVHRFP
jgi:hypothetical protein